MKKIFCLLFVSIGLFWSCIPNPAENALPGTAPENVLVKQLIETDAHGDVTTIDFTYLDKKIVTATGSDGLVTTYTYNGDLITKETTMDGATLADEITYVYDISNNLVSSTWVDYTDSSGSRVVYVHNADGTVSYQEFYGDTLIQDEVGEDGLINATQFIANVIMPANVDTETFTYDANNNPFKNILGYGKISFAHSGEPLNYTNNITSVVHSNTLGLSEVLSHTTYTYTDNNHFPITETSTDANDVVTDMVKYIYF